jgi:hypothetical protein
MPRSMERCVISPRPHPGVGPLCSPPFLAPLTHKRVRVRPGLVGALSRPFRVSQCCGPQRDMGSYVDGRPHDAGRRCHAGRHEPAARGPALGCAHPTRVRASAARLVLPELTDDQHTCTKQINKQIDSLVPAYACPAADAVRNAFQAVPAWTDHLNGNASLKARLDAVFGTAGLDAWASWCKFQFVPHTVTFSVTQMLHVLDDHFFDALTARTCHGHPLPCNDTTGTCLSEADAASVFAIGDFEYECVSPTCNFSPCPRRLLLFAVAGPLTHC